ncbi:MAG TPA: protein kinase, partial [Gemmataceae bacterium]|nr:protein kinase [Gemmataceae bacterium]
GEVADDFLRRLERGELIDVEEYAARNPAAADEIREALRPFRLFADVPSPAESSAVPSPEPAAVPVAGVLGDYRIVREVGRGGMGVVYEAEQLSLGRRVALKVLPFSALPDPRLVQRFKNEARAAAALDHPHVVKVFAVGEAGGVHFLAMQFIDGRPLSDLIRERRTGSANLTPQVSPDAPTATLAAPEAITAADAPVSRPPATPVRGDAAYFRQVATWGVQAAEALEHAHAMGVVHRDVKPGNLLLDTSGNVWVADFGLAKLAASDAGLTGTGDVLGTLRYMSPEQALSKHDLVDHRADVYALGATLYELLTGVPAVDGKDKADILRKITGDAPVPLRKLERGIPRDLETIALTCLRKDPADRYSSTEALAADLRRWLAGEPIRARPLGRVARAARWVRRNPRAAVVGGILLALTAGLAASSVMFWRQRDRAEQATIAQAQERERAEGLYEQAQAAYQREARHRKRARVAVDTMYTDVAEKLLPTEPGLGGPRKELLFKALAFYEEEATDRPDDPEARVGAAWANKRAARILWAAGENERARAFYDRAVRLAEELTAANPAAPDGRWLLAQCHFERSFVFGAMARSSQALDDRRLALRIYEQLAGEFPADRGYRAAEAHVCGSLASIEGEPAEQERLFRRSLTILAELRRTVAVPADRDSEVALVRLNFGQFLAGQSGQLAEAEKLLTQALETWRTLAGVPTAHAENLLHLGNSLIALAGVRLQREEADTAATAYIEEAKSAFRRLDRDYSGHTFSGHQLLGRALLKLGRVGEAVECLREAARLRGGDATTHADLGAALAAAGDPTGAEATYVQAVRLRLPSAEDSHRIGCALRNYGNWAAAEAAFRQAVRLRPGFARAHTDLGMALTQRGAYAEALTEHRVALQLDPELVGARTHIGQTLWATGDLAGSLAAHRAAVAADPDYATGHFVLGLALRGHGRLAESLECLKQAQELGELHPPPPRGTAEEIKRAEYYLDLERQLEDVRTGQAGPPEARKCGDLALVALWKQYSVAAARLFHQALAAEPHLDWEHKSNVVYNAACAAALAGAGVGRDTADLPELTRAYWRAQALGWLRIDLAAHGRNVRRGVPTSGPGKRSPKLTWQHWQTDPDLAGVRDPAALARLPEAEHQAWETFWAEAKRVLTTDPPAGPPVEIGPRPREIPS